MSNRKLTELFDHSSKLVDLLKRQPDRGGGRNRHIHEPGERFGSWTVVGMVEERRRGAICYLVRCVCGIEKVVPGGDVASKVVGWGLAGCGIILLAAPHTLPALGGG